MGKMQLGQRAGQNLITSYMNTFPNYTFREAQLSDLMFYYDSLSSTEIVLIDSFEFEINFKQKFEDVNYFMFVIEDLGKPVGLVVLQKVKNLSDPSPWVEILEFFILSKYRKLQAADYFYQKIEEYVKEMGIFKINVACKINSTITQHFYTKRGFKIQKKLYAKFIG